MYSEVYPWSRKMNWKCTVGWYQLQKSSQAESQTHTCHRQQTNRLGKGNGAKAAELTWQFAARQKLVIAGPLLSDPAVDTLNFSAPPGPGTPHYGGRENHSNHTVLPACLVLLMGPPKHLTRGAVHVGGVTNISPLGRSFLRSACTTGTQPPAP